MTKGEEMETTPDTDGLYKEKTELAKPTLNDLKAQAYDCLAQVELWQKRLADLNRQIAREGRNGRT